jgi:carbamoyl-phosphate synthase small subunit
LPDKNPGRFDVVVFDFGVKGNILRCLQQSGCRVHVVPSDTSAERVLSMRPDGIVLSNGPGDPAALHSIVSEVRQLIGQVPVLGICLGHQILGHALGGKTYKLKFGHRGGNQPVMHLPTKRVEITSHNHGFAVDADSLKSDVEPTYINLNDQTLEGFRSLDKMVDAVQFHPEAAPGPHDCQHIFDDFLKTIENFHR